MVIRGKRQRRRNHPRIALHFIRATPTKKLATENTECTEKKPYKLSDLCVLCG